MKKRKTVKVRMVVTIEVDSEKWMAEYGVGSHEVRHDARLYFEHQIHQSYPVIEGLASVEFKA